MRWRCIIHFLSKCCKLWEIYGPGEKINLNTADDLFFVCSLSLLFIWTVLCNRISHSFILDLLPAARLRLINWRGPSKLSGVTGFLTFPFFLVLREEPEILGGQGQEFLPSYPNPYRNSNQTWKWICELMGLFPCPACALCDQAINKYCHFNDHNMPLHVCKMKAIKRLRHEEMHKSSPAWSSH